MGFESLLFCMHTVTTTGLSIQSILFFVNAKFDTKSEYLALSDIPQHRWQDITVDFVTRLREVEEKDVLVDRRPFDETTPRYQLG